MARKRTLKEIDAEIAKLQEEASEIRDSEKAGVVAKMKDAIAYYGITAADLGLTGAGRTGSKPSGGAATGKKASTKRPGKTAAGRIKFKDDAGHAWSGFGPKPKWFVDALAGGKTEADLRA